MAKSKIKTKSKAQSKAKPKAKTAKKPQAKKSKPAPKKMEAAKAVKATGKINFKPLADRVLLKQNEEGTQTSGGIIIPDVAREKNQKGVVVAVGPGQKNKKGLLKPVMVKPGDNVLFDKYAGTKIEMNGAEYLILRESELIGVLD